ncbi:MAG: hypothetical protein ACK559_33290, partial [bacterium]
MPPALQGEHPNQNMKLPPFFYFFCIAADPDPYVWASWVLILILYSEIDTDPDLFNHEAKIARKT